MHTLTKQLTKMITFLGVFFASVAFWGILLLGVAIGFYYTAMYIVPFLGFALYAFMMLFCFFYIAYRASQSIINIYERLVEGTRRKKAYHYAVYRLAVPIEELPTSDSIQHLILQDGEIPDEALKETFRFRK